MPQKESRTLKQTLWKNRVLFTLLLNEPLLVYIVKKTLADRGRDSAKILRQNRVNWAIVGSPSSPGTASPASHLSVTFFRSLAAQICTSSWSWVSGFQGLKASRKFSRFNFVVQFDENQPVSANDTVIDKLLAGSGN